MTLPVYVAFDPGSARMGAVAGHWTAPTLTVTAAQKIAVASGDDGVIEAAAQAIEFALTHNAAGIIVERGQLYMPTGVTPQAATQIARAHAIMCRVADLIEALARAKGIPVERVPRASWAHRIIPHHRGGITDAMVLAALPGHIDPAGCALLVSKDLRDAAGALLWHFIPETPRKRRSRARVVDPNKTVVPRVVYTGADATIEAKAKRRRDRALAVSRKAHGTVERLGTPCACGIQHGRGRRPRACSQALNSTDQRVVAALTLRPMTARELGETIPSITNVLSRMMREGVVTHVERGGTYSLTSTVATS